MFSATPLSKLQLHQTPQTPQTLPECKASDVLKREVETEGFKHFSSAHK